MGGSGYPYDNCELVGLGKIILKTTPLSVCDGSGNGRHYYRTADRVVLLVLAMMAV